MKVLKFILIALNVITMIAGLVIAAVGAHSLWNLQPYGTDDTWGMLIALVQQFYPYAILVGSFIFLISVLGCCGVTKGSKCALCIYVGILLIILVLEVLALVVALTYAGQVLKTDTMKEYYEDSENGEFTKNLWDDLQQMHECCGVNGPQDWETYTEKAAPESCMCIKSNNTDVKCNNNNLFETGCQDAVDETYSLAKHFLVITAVAFGFLALLNIIYMCCLGGTVQATVV